MKRRGYIFKWHFLWLAWVLVQRDCGTYYFDNSKNDVVMPDASIKYLSFSLTRNQAQKKLVKWLERNVKK